jgi:ferredoxin-NADP reductase
LSVRLLANERATPTTRVVRVALDGVPYSYRAGQAAAVGVSADERLTPYSIASAPHDTSEHGYLEFLVKVDGSSRFGAIVSDLQHGSPMFVGSPSGSFALPEDATRGSLLFIAGGTGIAPMRSMIREVIHRDPHHRPALIYSARTPDEFAYLDEFRALADAGRIALTLTLTGDTKDWRHARGRMGPMHLDGVATTDSLCFICGPPGMVVEVPSALMALGVPADRIRTDGW